MKAKNAKPFSENIHFLFRYIPFSLIFYSVIILHFQKIFVISLNMKLNLKLTSILLILALTFLNEAEGKKKKSKKSSGKVKFDSKLLKCLVCRAAVNEFAWAVLKVDPTKKVDTGSWRLSADGQNQRQIVSV